MTDHRGKSWPHCRVTYDEGQRMIEDVCGHLALDFLSVADRLFAARKCWRDVQAKNPDAGLICRGDYGNWIGGGGVNYPLVESEGHAIFAAWLVVTGRMELVND